MASPEHIRRLSETFRAMGDGTRIRIILALSLDEFCVCDLAALLESTSPAVSHHLRILRALRLVKVRRRGRMAYYSLDDAHIERLFRMGLEHVEEG
jgi:DNA-binding transcriptional ArsR family regulator